MKLLQGRLKDLISIKELGYGYGYGVEYGYGFGIGYGDGYDYGHGFSFEQAKGDGSGYLKDYWSQDEAIDFLSAGAELL